MIKVYRRLLYYKLYKKNYFIVDESKKNCLLNNVYTRNQLKKVLNILVESNYKRLIKLIINHKKRSIVIYKYNSINKMMKSYINFNEKLRGVEIKIKKFEEILRKIELREYWDISSEDLNMVFSEFYLE